MSLIAARRRRTILFMSVAGLMVMAMAVSAISAEDASSVAMRGGMVMVTVGACLWLSWRLLIPAVLLAWIVPNLARSPMTDDAIGSLPMLLELPGLIGVGFFTWMARNSLRQLEHESVLIGAGQGELTGVNPETGLFDETQLRPSLAAELARSRRFGRTFALVLVGIDEMRQKFDFRDEAMSEASLASTIKLLQHTRLNVDRVFHYHDRSFAIILPESAEKDITGLVKRLRRLARSMRPSEGEPGGPMPVHFGATFFPKRATTVDDLLRRAEVALRIAAASTTRYQFDSAEAPELPPGETLRREPQLSTAPSSAPPPPSPIHDSVDAANVEEASADRARDAEATRRADVRFGSPH